jgi:hypothetical protein
MPVIWECAMRGTDQLALDALFISVGDAIRGIVPPQVVRGLRLYAPTALTTAA